jgi:IPT/TIG domain/Bacterial Ig-like domain (group 2)/Kelch motif/Galactose oxidase, central domain
MSPLSLKLRSIALFSFLILLASPHVIAAAPSITSLSPTSGAVGASVTIAGSGFGSTQGSSTVKFNGTTASVTSWSASSIVATVPSGATTGNVVVTVSGTASNGKSFTVLPTPSISSLSPTSGAVGAAVTISGSNFGSTQGSGTVKFNGTTATITSWSATSIVTKVPTGATTGNVVVSASGVNTNGVSFTVLATPSISSLSPTSGAVGASVTIAGSNFGSSQGSGTVKFNGTSATVTSWGASSIVATVPSGAMTGNVVVNASGVNTNGVSFTVVSAPNIASLSPTSGTVGTSVTITGTNFGSTQGSSTVKFNGTVSTPTSWSATSIKAPVPPGATTGNVVVHASGVDSNGKSFTVTPTPTITSLSPSSAPVGTSITVTGTNFGATQGTSTIKFNGTTATPTSWSSTSIAVPVPTGATTGNVVVTVSGVASNGVSFTVTTLVSIGVTPANAVISIVGGTQQFTATGTYSDNSTQNLTSTATWTSSTTTVATINSAGLATAVAPGQTAIQAKVGTVTGTASLSVPGFKPTGNLLTGRAGATATQLNNGLVLVVGGTDTNSSPLASAELYNPTTGTFTATGSLNTARAGFTATLLVDGTVLIAGGQDSNGNLLSSAEVFNPASGTFVVTGGMNDTRLTHTATLLANGKVLLAGGTDLNGNGLASAELYDPANGAFTSTGTMNSGRRFHTASLLNTGKVLVVGGSDGSGNTTTSAELYDPTAGTFTTISPMNAARFTHTATLLNSGLVLIAGGYDQNFSTLSSAELYDPVAGTFTITGALLAGRGSPTATLLNNGQVLFVGGTNQGVNVTDAELYDPIAGTFATTSSPAAARYIQTATLLGNGSVLVAGGSPTAGGAYSSAELYQPPSLIPANLVSITVNPSNPAIPLGTPQKLIAIGTMSNSTQQTLSSVSWSSSNTAVATVSTDATDQGVVYGVAAGSATISACTGTLCGSTSVTVIAPDPDISALSPTSGPVGSLVTITGSGFGAMQGKSSVTLNESQATAASWSPTSIVISVPNDSSGNISVQIGGVSSNLMLFTVLPTPTISNVSPTSGDVGASIEIDGTNFGDTQGSSTATLNGVPLTVTSWSATAILGTVPSSATTGNIVVTVGGVASNPVSFSVTSVPTIFALSPNLGPVGTLVTISGADFGATQGTSTVTFNGVVASVSAWSSTSVTAVVPIGAATGAVVVTVGGTVSNAVGFTVPGAPNISSLSPTFGIVGTTVTINGSNFGATQGTSSVSFNGTLATVTSWNSAQIIVTVPTGAASGNVTVTATGVTGTAAYFAVTGPHISSVSTSSAQIGQQIVVKGSFFGATQGSSTIAFNGVPATGTFYWSDQEIDPIVPSGATTGHLTVTVNGATADGGSFTIIPAPVIVSVSPGSAVVGTPVTIGGNNFGTSVGEVYFCGWTTSVTSWSSTSIVLPVPASCNNAGSNSGQIMVEASLGSFQYTYPSNSQNFTVLPNITSLSPTSGTVGTQVQINGTSFGYGPGTLTFNGVAAIPISWSPTQIVAYPPVGATTGNVVVTSGGSPSNGANFTVLPSPVISSLSRSDGDAGLPITISGSGFGSSQGSSTVTFNGLAATASAWGNTSITVSVPSGATTGNVVVNVGGAPSNPVPFTIDATPVISGLSQTSGSPGTLISIIGSNFLDTQGTSTVTFNGTAATVSFWNANTIGVTVPSATTGNVVVTVLGQASAGVRFTVTSAPNITSLSPTSGPAGVLVTINGANFGSSQGQSYVTFNGVFAAVASWTSTKIVAAVPEGTSTGPVVVTVNGGPSNNSTFTITSGPGLASLSPTSGGVGAVVTVTGANFGASQGTSTVKFNSTTAAPASWSDTTIVVPVPSGATTGNVTVVVGGTASNGISFTVAGLNLSSVAPTSGNTGEAVTITGTGFGSTKGSSTLTFNGVAASVSSWSNTSIIASVPSPATTGPVIVTVSGAASDPVNFTIQPQIMGISPQPAALGAQMTITGENFGVSQGSSTLTCNGSPVSPSSWNSTTITFYGCFNLGANPIDVTVNGVSSQPASIEGIPDPVIKSVTPYPAPTGARIRIIGQNFGATRGQSTVTINGASGAPSVWSDTAIFVTVPSSATQGYGTSNVTVGGIAATFGFQVGTNPAPTSLRISPSNVNMLIGATQQFTVVDQNGQVRPEATWTIDNSSLAAITTDYSPVLTALAAGTVTLTANAQGVQVQTTVTISALTSLPVGTVIWSVPPVPGGVPAGIFQAVPTDFGPASYSVQKSTDGTQTYVQGVTTDGQVMWESGLAWPYADNGVPDGNGGLLVMGACNTTTSIPMSITDMTSGGGSQWRLTMTSSTPGVCPAALPSVAIRQDGAVVVAPSMGVSPALLILDGQTGQQMNITPAIPPSTITTNGGITNTCDCFTPLGPPVVDSDGSIYFEYTVRNEDFTAPVNKQLATILWLMKIAPDGTTSNTQVSSSDSAILWPGTIIPDGQGGIVSTWIVDSSPIGSQAQHPYQGAHFLPGAAAVTPYNLPLAPTGTYDLNQTTGRPVNLPLVLGENGAAFVTYYNEYPNSLVVSYNIDSGMANWNYQSAQGVSTMSYTNGGGITLVDPQSNVIPLDSGGNPGTILTLPSYSSLEPSWDGTWQAQSASLAASIAPIQFPAIDWGHSLWGTQKGNPSQTGTAKENPWFPHLPNCPSSQTPCIYNALDDLVQRLKDPTIAQLAQTQIFNNLRGKRYLTSDFISYLTATRPRFYDGLRSTYCSEILDNTFSELWCFQNWIGRYTINLFSTDVRDKFTPDVDALTHTPGNPLLTFFRPESIGQNPSGLGQNLGNEGLIFHEALHGLTGLQDFQIEDDLHMNSAAHASCSITARIQNKVLSKSTGLDPSVQWINVVPCPLVGDE